MNIGRTLGTIVILMVSLCCPVPSAHAQATDHSGSTPAAASSSSQSDAAKQDSKAAGGQAAKSNAKDADKSSVKQPDKAGADKKSVTDETKDKTPTPALIQWTTAILDRLLTWVVVALVFVFVFRKQLGKLIGSLTDAFADRGVTLEVANVKIQVSERAQQLDEDRGTRFSVSPLDLAQDPYDGFGNTIEMPPQVGFQVSDYAAQWWVKHTATGPDLAQAVVKALADLESKIPATKSLNGVKLELVACATALEKVRFIEAARFTNLIATNEFVLNALPNLGTDPNRDPDDCMIRHAAGVGYAQASEWADARKVLEPIAWKDEPPGRPSYLRAGDVWLVALYHDSVEKARNSTPSVSPDTFIQTILSTTDEVVKKAKLVRDELGKAASPDPLQNNRAFYIREVNKALGTISSIRADYLESRQEKETWLQLTLDAFLKCVASIGGEGPSPLDHNNLADTYRQLGALDEIHFARAHEEIDKAVDLQGCREDPTFLNTEGWIFIDENKLPQAFDVLTCVKPEAMIARDPSWQDLVQYVENLILAAKVACSADNRLPSAPTKGPGTEDKVALVVRMSRGADVLERALRFLNDNAIKISDDGARARLTAELYELLGYVYLRLDGYDQQSVQCYEELAKIWSKVSVTADVRWRRRLIGVRAYTQRAKVARRDFDYGTAANQRGRGRKVFTDNAEELEGFSLKKGLPPGLLLRIARMKLDTAMALQGLAEESFHGGELDSTKDLLDRKDAILASLGDYREHEALGPYVRLATALTGLLRGWLAFRSDPGTYDPKVLTEIEKNLISARGQNATLDCQADLALGEAFLAAALNGVAAAAATNYRKATIALELAAGREAPALRGDAIRALTDAYTKSPAIQRRTKKADS